MKRIHLLFAAVAATASVAAGAAPSTTDEARWEAGQRIAAAEHAASLQLLPASEGIRVTDSDSARWAAGQLNTQRDRDSHLAEVLRAGSGAGPVPIPVTDTDSARAAAAEAHRERSLLAEHQHYVNTQAQIAPTGSSVSN